MLNHFSNDKRRPSVTIDEPPSTSPASTDSVSLEIVPSSPTTTTTTTTPPPTTTTPLPYPTELMPDLLA